MSRFYETVEKKSNDKLLTRERWTVCRIVAAYRKWLAGRGGGGPLPMPEGSEVQPQPQLLDRFSQHTKNCPSCSRVRC